MSNNWIIIIFGATGDLSRKKLIPALYNILESNLENLNFIFIGAAKEKVSIDQLFSQIYKTTENINRKIWNKLKEKSYYYQVNFNNFQDFKNLSENIIKIEKEHNLSCSNRLIYLATPADFFCTITKACVKTKIIEKKAKLKNCLHKIVYEKPFGWDLESAKQINNCIKKLLSDEQIYRIDHYLTKTLVNSIALIRFSNIIFEPIWNKDFIDHIQIIFNETVSIEDRGEFYDRYGALKDVVQNHMFQLLSLIAMDKPKTLNTKSITKAKCQILDNIYFVDGILGQYSGYLKEKNIDKNSRTETFAVLKCFINSSKWHNMPVYLKTGKNLNKKSTEIHVVFKPVAKKLFLQNNFFDPNIFSIYITPDSGISLHLNIQKDEQAIEPVNMSFCYNCVFGYEITSSYVRILSDIIKDDKNISVSWCEIETSWYLINQINKLQLPLYYYKPKSSGPKQAEKFAKKNNFTWKL